MILIFALIGNLALGLVLAAWLIHRHLTRH
jgi:hypothetical protein